MADRIDITVIIAAVTSGRTLEASLRALEGACRGFTAEILVVGWGGTNKPALRTRYPQSRLVEASATALVPELWSAGIEQARGEVVALTTDYMVVSPRWARSLVARLLRPVGGVGGPLDVLPGTGVVDWAIFYLRYSAFLHGHWPDGPVAGEIAGDNAAYLLDDLRRHADAFRAGFWEIEFHRLLRQEGRTLEAVSAAQAWVGPSYRLGSFLRHRFQHGVQFGQSRVTGGARRPWLVVAAAPVVPFLLAWRAASRIWPDGAHMARFVAALPVFLLMATAWATGEAVGALTAKAHRPRPALANVPSAPTAVDPRP